MIELSDIGLRFENRWIFQGASLRVDKGRSAAIIGPSGSGKSSLLKCLAGLLPPTEGEIRIASRNIGMLFQKNALFNSLTVEENLLFPLKERKGLTGKKATEIASNLLHRVGLSGTEELFPDELSGGMQKRLGIARALIVQPEILLYDDPTAGLDPITSRHIADLIRSFQADQGTTYIVVTSDMSRAYQLGDELFLLAAGKLASGGTPEYARNSSDPTLRQFLSGAEKGPLTEDSA